MTRLIIVAEGQTEREFVLHVLAPHLATHGVYASATIVGKLQAQRRSHRSRGGGHFGAWRRDIEQLLRQGDAGCYVTTLFDLYGLPDDFPAAPHLRAASSNDRAAALEQALAQVFNADRRFIPYLQLHEFEALVLAALPQLKDQLDDAASRAGVDQLVAELAGQEPEAINDSPETAPSKRLLRAVPGYRKNLHGPEALQAATLAVVRARCPRFNTWLTRLEQLGALAAL